MKTPKESKPQVAVRNAVCHCGCLEPRFGVVFDCGDIMCKRCVLRYEPQLRKEVGIIDHSLKAKSLFDLVESFVLNFRGQKFGNRIYAKATKKQIAAWAVKNHCRLNFNFPPTPCVEVGSDKLFWVNSKRSSFLQVVCAPKAAGQSKGEKRGS